MKKKSKIKTVIIIIVAIILSATITTGIFGYAMFADKISAAGSVKKLEHNLYYMEYEGNYGFEEFLQNGGASSESEMAAYLISFMSGGFWKNEPEDVSLDFGCSTLTTNTAEGTIMGRNFDWSNGSTGAVMIIHTKPSDGYESYSTTWLDFLGFGEGFTPESFGNKYMSIAGVYVPLDGINEMGLCVADLLAGDNYTTNQQTEKPDLTTTSAIRLLLDKASTVEEAVNLLSEYDMHSSIGTSHHLAISDASGKSVVVEYIDNVMTVTDTPAVTNHYLSEGSKQGIGNEESHKRFEKLLNAKSNVSDVMDMKDCLEAVSYASETQWSIVYNLDKKALDFYFHRNFESSYSYTIE
ncbi:MAG: linear amide C-N hydrolase [Ruminococcus sp.]|nr:linear amide C-N hydrolase [Ruminococcus sp.]